MKIKTKLALWVGVLFLLIILLSLVGAKYINALKADTENILLSNYNSLEYARNILMSLDDSGSESIRLFEANLQRQEKNISEIGEQELTAELRAGFEQYLQHPTDSVNRLKIRQTIFRIMDMNMQAIQRKSELAKSTANTALFWIVLTGTLCFMIAFVLLINLPSNIANPIQELTKSIRQIAAENYSERVHFEGHSEFGDLAKSFNTMAEKLEEYNSSNLAKLMMEKRRIETLINNMHDPVLGLDETLKIIFINEEALKVTGLTFNQVMGKQAQDLAVQNDLIRSLIKDLMVSDQQPSTYQTQSLKIFNNGKDGYFEKDILNISIVPTGENEKKLIGHVIVLRNVTAYKELDFAKTNFIATVSHEFKTPISSIQMGLHLLENEQVGSLNGEQKNLIESIKDDTNRLLKITGELLKVTQIESGNIQLSILPANPKEILNYAIQSTKTQVDQKRIRIQITCPENLPQVLADTEKTAWVLTNLISNAIRYSYEDSTIFVGVEEVDQEVVFTVKDSGQGIAPQYKEKVFDRYFRIPGSQTEGTGLGLAISKEFIEAQGGNISVESEFGAGSTFTVTLHAAG